MVCSWVVVGGTGRRRLQCVCWHERELRRLMWARVAFRPLLLLPSQVDSLYRYMTTGSW